MTDEDKVVAVLQKHFCTLPLDVQCEIDLREIAKEAVDSLKSFTVQITSASIEEDNLEDPHFKGVAYEKEIDQIPLAGAFFQVFKFMIEHEGWHTDIEISEETEVYTPSVARMRSYARSKEWGSHIVERRRRYNQRIFEYRLIPNVDSLTYKKYSQSSLVAV